MTQRRAATLATKLGCSTQHPQEHSDLNKCPHYVARHARQLFQNTTRATWRTRSATCMCLVVGAPQLVHLHAMEQFFRSVPLTPTAIIRCHIGSPDAARHASTISFASATDVHAERPPAPGGPLSRPANPTRTIFGRLTRILIPRGPPHGFALHGVPMPWRRPEAANLPTSGSAMRPLRCFVLHVYLA